MKKFYFATLLIFSVHLVSAKAEGFSGLEKTMDAETYEMAGLSKLTSEERTALDNFIRDYIAQKQKDAAAVAAVESLRRAVKEGRVRTPEIIESKIAGTFKGTGLRTVFALENGEVWKPTNDEIAPHSALENPKVVIYHDSFGYKMFVEGVGAIRVKRVR